MLTIPPGPPRHHDSRPAVLTRTSPWAAALLLLVGLGLVGCSDDPGVPFPQTQSPGAVTPTYTSGVIDPTHTVAPTATAPASSATQGNGSPTAGDGSPTPTNDGPTASDDETTPTASGATPTGDPGTAPDVTLPPTAQPTPTAQGPTVAEPTPTSGPTPRADADGDGFLAPADCDDQNPAVNPGAAEVCNTLDDDCDGLIDDGDSSLDQSSASIWYQDADGDTYGDAAASVIRCVAPLGYVTRPGDCNDSDGDYRPGAPESCTDEVDYNCDGAVGFTDGDGDGVAACEDCDDANPQVYPGAIEVCDPANNDEDCNGFADNSDQGTDASSKTRFWPDDDRDGFGDASHPGGLFCDAPTAYVPNGSDCDDDQPGVNPEAAELCNGRDDDCDTRIDDDDDDVDPSSASTWYLDGDSDTYGAAGATVLACQKPAGASANDDDCDDSDPAVYPGAPERCEGGDDDCDTRIDEGATQVTYYADSDGDSWGDDNSTTEACEQPQGTSSRGGDCDDSDADVNPGAIEVCDAQNTDENCNGLSDNSDTTADADTKGTFYPDDDGDAFGDDTHPGSPFCDAPTGYVSIQGDCDDSSAAISPDATEVCGDGGAGPIDEDCDGLTDDNDDSLDTGTAHTWYQDSDEDGAGSSDVSQVACVAPNRYVADDGDCDDTNPDIGPGASEVCNELDDDCDTTIDEGVGPTTWYGDDDDDGYGETDDATVACEQPASSASAAGDCDDDNPAVNPGATEICNEIDDDCDAGIDEGVGPTTWYDDFDQDGFGDPEDSTLACANPGGHVTNGDDCDDGDSTIKPGASEVCNEADDDCDTAVDEDAQPDTWYDDGDGDGYGDPGDSTTSCTQPAGHVRNPDDCNDNDADVSPEDDERCGGADEDCDGQTDEAGAADAQTYYADGDGDGVGVEADTAAACAQPAGYASSSGDCDDDDSDVYPGASEDCNEADDDCDSLVDEGTAANTYPTDADGDGFGHPSNTIESCVLCPECADNTDDCDDSDAQIYPGAPELLDDRDNNCDGQVEMEIPIDQAHGSYEGTVSGGFVGYEVDIVGDFDGDGFDDIAVGAPRINNRAGGAYLIWGHGGSWGHTTIADGPWRINGTALEAEYGRAVSGGDLDGDGLGDLFLGAPFATNNAGQTDNGGSISIIYGRSQRPADDTVEAIEDSFSDGYFDQVQLGYSMDGHGDINGDGYDDLLVGAPWYYITMVPPAGGYVFVLPGKSNQYGGLFGIEGNVFIQYKGEANQIIGLNATHTGDFTSDGYGDFIATGYGEIGGTVFKEEDVGVNYLVAGADTEDLPAGQDNAMVVSDVGPASWFGDNDDDLVGQSAANLGDINGDGFPDFALGRDRRNSDEPMAFVFLGGGPVPSTGEAEERAHIEIFSSTALPCPCTVGGIGDVNGDGFADLAVASTEESGGGRIFIFYGSSFSKEAAPSVINAETEANKIIYGELAGDEAGFSIAGKGDVNGDGRDDFVISARGKDTAAGVNAGKIYVFHGWGQ